MRCRLILKSFQALLRLQPRPAWLGKELTLSGVPKTIIMTRYEGKTPFPERERLPALAASGATLAIHLGVTRIHKIVEELIPHYGEDCPITVCYRTS